MEADIVEIDFVLGSRGDMRLLSRAKKRRLRVNRQSGRHKMKSNRKHKKEESQQIMEQKIIKVCEIGYDHECSRDTIIIDRKYF